MTHLAYRPEATSRTRAGAHVPGPRGPRHLAAVLLIAAAALAACQFAPGELQPGDQAPPDADPSRPDATPVPIDANPNAPDAAPCAWSYTPKFVDPCATGKPDPGTFDLILTADLPYVYETTNGTLIGSTVVIPSKLTTDEDGVRTIWVRNVMIEAGVELRVQGDFPLMIVASGEITVNGTIDASSARIPSADRFDRGPGLNEADCAVNAAEEGSACGTQGGSGGGGGSFGGAGGDGGFGGGLRGCGDGNDSSPGGAGGAAVLTLPDRIRAGCDGKRGGDGEEEGRYGIGGVGGGAVHLVARQRLQVGGTIHAGGAGGYGAQDKRAGGGGGGSGGFIGLEAPELIIQGSAVLAANGGGGGGGTNDEGDATAGENALTTDDPAPGGGGYTTGVYAAVGGPGSAGDTKSGSNGGDGDRGGGGGGGGAGYIILYQDDDPTIIGDPTISPQSMKP
ncbi:MAG TPA: hypothetical protein VNM90_02200 [Haliangium sp.]|nr:hypothetical protein [Haliangium sp.]